MQMVVMVSCCDGEDVIMLDSKTNDLLCVYRSNQG